MQQLEELQNKNNKLTVLTIAMGACIKQVRDCSDPYEATELMHGLVDVLEATVSAFEDFANCAAGVLDEQIENFNGGSDACNELY